MMERSETSDTNMSATSTTKSDAADVISFATFRITGDRLVPSEITNLLEIAPTVAYQKGEKIKFGPRSPESTGKTGIWYLSTDHIVSSSLLDDHLRYIFKAVVLPAGDALRFPKLHNLLRRKNLKAHLTIFWHGPPKAKKPPIPPMFAGIFGMLPADIQVDFDTDDEAPAKRAR